ncbi:MAG: hypothetical protein LBQ31_11525 [Bacteroidales bacterium]|jgi:hypothetical protein|nr:hypothetical protein [Bacteroidales bacterium]
MNIINVSSREFRANQKSFFDLADNGAQILLHRRRKRSYILTSVNDNDMYFTPELIERIEMSKQQAREGKVKTLKTPEDIDKLLGLL